MCLALYRPAAAGQLDLTVLDTARSAHPHGFGIMYADGGTLHTYRGVDKDEWEKFKSIVEIVNDMTVPMALHFRYATHGSRVTANAHPAMVHTGSLAMMHNGVLRCVDDCKNDRSDTRVLAEDFLQKLPARWWKNEQTHMLIGDYIGKGNKLILMHRSGYVALINEKQGLWEGGVWYSNGTFRPAPKVQYEAYGAYASPHRGAYQGRNQHSARDAEYWSSEDFRTRWEGSKTVAEIEKEAARRLVARFPKSALIVVPLQAEYDYEAVEKVYGKHTLFPKEHGAGGFALADGETLCLECAAIINVRGMFEGARIFDKTQGVSEWCQSCEISLSGNQMQYADHCARIKAESEAERAKVLGENAAQYKAWHDKLEADRKTNPQTPKPAIYLPAPTPAPATPAPLDSLDNAQIKPFDMANKIVEPPHSKHKSALRLLGPREGITVSKAATYGPITEEDFWLYATMFGRAFAERLALHLGYVPMTGFLYAHQQAEMKSHG